MSRRRLNDDERALWKGFTRSIAPLRKPQAAEVQETEPPTAPPATKSRVKPMLTAPPAHAAPKPGPPPLAPLDRRMKRRVARGRDAIDGRLDLHGLSQAEAHDALFRFLRAKHAQGARMILVITGKGTGGSNHGGRGVLKRMVPQWLGQPEFRSMIISLEPASIAHGGEGALYIRLRKLR